MGSKESAQPWGNATSHSSSTGLSSLPAIIILQLLGPRQSLCSQQGDVVGAAVDGRFVGAGVDLLRPQGGKGVAGITHNVRLQLHKDLQGRFELLLAARREDRHRQWVFVPAQRGVLTCTHLYTVKSTGRP